MDTFLDLFIVVSLVLIVISFLSSLWMFLVKNMKIKRICFYITAALGIYIGTVGYRIQMPGFLTNGILAVLFALVAIAAILSERTSKENNQQFLVAQVLSTLSVFTGLINTFFIIA